MKRAALSAFMAVIIFCLVGCSAINQYIMPTDLTNSNLAHAVIINRTQYDLAVWGSMVGNTFSNALKMIKAGQSCEFSFQPGVYDLRIEEPIGLITSTFGPLADAELMDNNLPYSKFTQGEVAICTIKSLQFLEEKEYNCRGCASAHKKIYKVIWNTQIMTVTEYAQKNECSSLASMTEAQAQTESEASNKVSSEPLHAQETLWSNDLWHKWW